jgi:glycosyltransferase involved in cell wall biosynthesis
LHGQVDVGINNWKAWLKARLLSATAGRIVMVSNALAADLRQSLDLPESRVQVIYNGVPVHREARIRSCSSGRRLIAVGNIRAPKNYPELVAAFAIVRQSLPDVHLDILGEPDRGTIYAELVVQVKELGLEDAVTFHGFVADPSDLLREANAFVLASSKEGFSLAIVESMLAGVPVISTRSGGPEEIIEHERTGLLVPGGDPAALAQAIMRVLTEPETAARLANRAHDHAAHTFGLDEMVSAYEGLYANLLNL